MGGKRKGDEGVKDAGPSLRVAQAMLNNEKGEEGERDGRRER